MANALKVRLNIFWTAYASYGTSSLCLRLYIYIYIYIMSKSTKGLVCFRPILFCSYISVCFQLVAIVRELIRHKALLMGTQWDLKSLSLQFEWFSVVYTEGSFNKSGNFELVIGITVYSYNFFKEIKSHGSFYVPEWPSLLTTAV